MSFVIYQFTSSIYPQGLGNVVAIYVLNKATIYDDEAFGKINNDKYMKINLLIIVMVANKNKSSALSYPIGLKLAYL